MATQLQRKGTAPRHLAVAMGDGDVLQNTSLQRTASTQLQRRSSARVQVDQERAEAVPKTEVEDKQRRRRRILIGVGVVVGLAVVSAIAGGIAAATSGSSKGAPAPVQADEKTQTTAAPPRTLVRSTVPVVTHVPLPVTPPVFTTQPTNTSVALPTPTNVTVPQSQTRPAKPPKPIKFPWPTAANGIIQGPYTFSYTARDYTFTIDPLAKEELQDRSNDFLPICGQLDVGGWPQWRHLQNQIHGECIGIDSGDNLLYSTPCDDTSRALAFCWNNVTMDVRTVPSDASDGDLCLGIPGKSVYMTLVKCAGNNGVWGFNQTNGMQIFNSATGLCLDVQHQHSGAPLVYYECKGPGKSYKPPNQWWLWQGP
eukprot:comp22246_c0_seq1/m.32837 comp22246_c0_seq1/g.32837  ORF comp22246_c0_seq1/g.32837 comp22246_c0_seq1/m.32837 type:complete len:368 (-) comp22246_c0_seq1:386-1489(-)